MQLIDQNRFTLTGVFIPEDTTKEEWLEQFRQVLLCKHASSIWRKEYRKFGARKWDVAFAADSEVQIEMDLGLALQDEEPRVNAADKSIGLVTIEGIAQRFVMWSRKVSDEMPRWDRDQLTKALELLAPIEKKAAEIRAMIAGT